MKKVIALTFLFLVFAVGASAQTACPENTVCMTRDAAEFLLKADDERKALRVENGTLRNENTALRTENTTLRQETTSAVDAKNVAVGELHKTQIELAKTVGEKTQLEAASVRTNALVDVLIQNARPKKVGFINLF